jgi:metal-responsive CopG/Arc/MetJ family transcriptional regulator
MPRFSIEMPASLLRRIDAASKRNLRSRNAEVRVLLGEALDARKRAEEEKSEAGA